jgi:hypothetical protein
MFPLDEGRGVGSKELAGTEASLKAICAIQWQMRNGKCQMENVLGFSLHPNL